MKHLNRPLSTKDGKYRQNISRYTYHYYYDSAHSLNCAYNYFVRTCYIVLSVLDVSDVHNLVLISSARARPSNVSFRCHIKVKAKEIHVVANALNKMFKKKSNKNVMKKKTFFCLYIYRCLPPFLHGFAVDMSNFVVVCFNLTV